MKFFTAALLLVGALFVNNVAYADADDTKWIVQCVKENADAKVSPEVVNKYCTCMNNKMDSNETKSIAEWEKTHAKERAECDKESGWK